MKVLGSISRSPTAPDPESEDPLASSVKGEWCRHSKMKITFIFHFDTHKTTTAQQGKHNSYTKHM